MSDWRQRFEAMVAELAANPRVILRHAELNPPASDAVIEEARRVIGGPLPEGMEDFHRALDGFRLSWRLRVEALDREDPRDRELLDLFGDEVREIAEGRSQAADGLVELV